MNRVQARKLAQEKYGPAANVVNVCHKDRHQRFGIMLYVPGGALGDPVLGCLGHGDSYDTAWAHAEENPTAQQIARQWIQTQKDYQEFRVDPVGYKQRKTEQMDKALKESNNG